MNTIYDFFIIVYDFLEKQFVDITSVAETYFFEYGYDAILIYSKLQIFLTPYYVVAKDYITKQWNNIFPSKEEPNIEFIKNGQTIFSIDEKKVRNDETLLPTEYDFIVYTDKTNKVLYKTFPDNFDYEVSKIKFFFIEFQYDDDIRRAELSLKTDTYNYYIVNNIMDAPFIKYFLQKHYPDSYDESNTDYTLEILDNTVSKLMIDETQYLRILANSYSLDE